MGKGRPRAVEKGVGHAPASAGSLIVPPAPVFHPTEEEFKDPLAFIDKIRPQAELFGICRIVPPPSWSPPPFSPDLNSLKFPTKAQAIHRLQSRPADCDPHTFALEYRRFIATQLGRNLSRWRPPVFEGADLDLCLLFNAVKRFGGYDRVCKEKRWGDVFPLVRPGAVPTACSKHVLSQLYCEHLCDYEDHLARLNRTTKKSKGSSSSDQKVMKRSLTQPEKPGGKRRKGSAGERVVKDEFDQICEQCKSGLHGEVMLLCDRCDKGWHLYCLTPPLESIPSGNWYCQDCVNSGKDSFGFVPAKCCSVEAFQRMDDRARRKWFGQGHATRSEIEKRFWDIVEGRSGEVEVMYGNDLDTSSYGSGFPRASDPIPASVDPEKWKEYCASPWNLNNLPKLQGSMLRAVHDNIAGVMVPWLYIGMLFSSFCWHVEDHCLYSINYLHWGEPKRWYGVPGGDANAFEQVMRKTLPDLFDAQPDLLFQLVTMLSPSVLQENGVPVYGVVQEPGNFVITFPRSFHGGFNFGLNCAEAVNFAPADWLPHGGFGAELYRVYHKAAVLSHEELLYVVAKNGCDTKALPYLKEEMHRIFAREKRCREELWRNGIVRSSLMSPKKHPLYVGTEEDPTCIICQQYLYLSAITCSCRPSAFVCLEHWKHLCECNPNKHRLLYRHTLAELHDLVQMCSHVNETCVAAEKPISKIPHLHQTAHNESSPMRKKVKVGHVTYAQLAEDWLLKSCDILEAPFSKVAYSTALKEAEQFLWADHDMDPVRDVANKLTEIQKWALNVRSCLSKIDLCCHKDDSEKVSILEVEKLLGFDSSCCFEPELNKLKAYARDARMLVGEIQSALSCQLHVEELELVFSRAVAFPIYVEETGKLAREISSAKVWRKNAKECLSERRPGALKIEFLDKLRSEMLELHVQIPEKKLLLDFCREVESWQTRCKKTEISSLKLKELEGFLHDAENVTVSIPELELLRQFLNDAHSWIHHVHDVLQNISERDDHENVIRELSCILKSGQMLRVQVDELQLVETELKRSCCREKASKALSVHMPLEFIQLLITEASILGIENEILFMEISKMLAAAVSWEEQAKFVLGHVAHLPKFEDLIRSSKDISVILPSLPHVKDVVSFAQSWISRSQPYLASTMRDADAVGPLLKVDNLKELVAQSKFLKVTLEAPEKLESILKEVDEWAHSACSLLQHSNSLLYEHDEKFRIDSHLSVEIEGLLNGIDSALEIANSLRFEFSEALKLQHASLILKWSLKALSFCSRFPLWEEVDILLEDADNFPDTFSGNNLTKMLIEGANWLRKACTVVLESQSSKRCKLKDAEEILEESKRIVVSYPVMVAKLQNAIRKHESWVERANAFFRHPGEQSWALLLKLKEAGKADAFDCPELDKVALEVEKVEKWMHECRVLVEPLVGKHGSLFLELTQIKDTLDRALSIYHSSKGCGTRTFCVCCAYKSENEEEFTCCSCDDRFHYSCIGPPFATEGMVNEYDCPLCLCMQNGTISRNGRRILIRRGNRPDLNSFIQLLSVAMDFCAGIAERALLQEIVKLALDCKSCLGEIVNRSLSHRGKDVSSVSESLLRTLKAVAVAGVYDHQDGCSLYSALSKHSWKIRVAKLLRDPKKPVIQQIQHLLREGQALGVPYEDHFMKEITKVQKISLQWADMAKKVASDLGTLELSEVYKLIDEGETLPVLFEKEMKLLKARGILYCICRKPYDQRAMIACDQCDEWYHFECIHLLGPPPKKFFCPACKPTNGEFISLPPSIHHKERSSNEGEPWTPPTCLNESRIRPKSTNSQREMLVSIDLCNILKCCNEIDRLWRENRRPLQRITRKRCNTESLSFFPISRCK